MGRYVVVLSTDTEHFAAHIASGDTPSLALKSLLDGTALDRVVLSVIPFDSLVWRQITRSVTLTDTPTDPPTDVLQEI